MGVNEEIGSKIFREIEVLKSSQMRIESLEYLLSFYKELSGFVYAFQDVFEAYKENFEVHKHEYQKDIEEIFQRGGIPESNLNLVLSRSEEKMHLLIECIGFITRSIVGTIRPKRKGVQESRKITKGRLLETIKLLEQYVLSIQESSSTFLSPHFIETQRIRTAFMLDAMHHLLDLTAAELRHYPYLFEPKTVLLLEETSSSAHKFPIVKHQRKGNTGWKHLRFRLEFMGRFELRMEKAMRGS
jgi:hypothetical protein